MFDISITDRRKMQKRSNSNIPEEIMAEILSWVPAKSVGQLRCVSKSWRSLLSEPEFIRTHLIHTQFRQQSLIIWRTNLYFGSLNHAHHMLDEITLSFTRFADQDVYWKRIFGACNGLLLVGAERGKLFLLNPVTREIKQVPPPPIDGRGEFLTVYGLGYDSVGNDYKAVTITNYFTEGYFPLVKASIFSLKRGCWTSLEGCPQNYDVFPDNGAFVGECINWLANDKDQDSKPVILGFNLVDEMFREVPLPTWVQREKFRGKRYDVLNGCFCIFNKAGQDVWVMREYGVQDSWVRYKISDPECRFVCFLNPEQVLMLKEGSYVAYSLKDGAQKEVAVHGIAFAFYYAKTFTESLVSPHGCHET